MQKTTILEQDFYYHEANDPVIDYLKNGNLFGLHNYVLAKHFIENRNKNGWIIDCGAHIGTFGFAPVLENKNVLLIEAADKNCDCLKSTFGKFNNAIVEQAIVLDETKSCEFSTNYGPFGFVDLNINGKQTSNTIDGICNKHKIKNVALLKIDIEGFEGEALLGAQKTLAKSKPIILSEINGHCLRLRDKKPSYILEILDKLDYLYFLPNNGSLIPINKSQKFPFCVTDIICIHRSEIYSFLGVETFTRYLNDNEIEEIIKNSYSSSNEDCIKYFDTLK